MSGDGLPSRDLANALPHVVWTCDARGVLEWINDRWYDLTGLPAGETIGWRAQEAIHPDDVAEVRRRWGEAIATVSRCEIEYRIRTRDGSYRWHLAHVAPVLTVDGAIARWVATAFDIQGRREMFDALRASERRFETAFLLNPLPMAISAIEGQFLQANDPFLAMIGFSLEEIRGKTTVDLGLVTEEQRAITGLRLRAEMRAEIEMPIRTKNGRMITIVLTTTHVDFGGERCLLGVVRDVTEQRAAEAALREADRRKDEFLALLSHELRNPLAPIITAAQLMELHGDERSAQERMVILRQARHMVRLVDDLLDVSRVARGKVTITKKPRALPAVIANAVEATRPLFEAREHRLSLEIAPKGLTVEGDDVRLTQVISNLLTNAARYTPPGGHIEVFAARRGEHAIVRVRDNGDGIAPELLPEVFEMFVQGPRGPDRALGGLGLGLALVRVLTELHGGTVTAASDGLGCGSEFTVQLPATNAPATDPSGIIPLPSPLQVDPRFERVLVVDDNRDGAGMIANLLVSVGHEVRIAHDPSMALATAASFQPQVAILDLGLPVMDGYALAGELRARLPMPPVMIALTGYGQDRDMQRTHDAGFAHHLVKPVYVETLVDLIAKLGVQGR